MESPPTPQSTDPGAHQAISSWMDAALESNNDDNSDYLSPRAQQYPDLIDHTETTQTALDANRSQEVLPDASSDHHPGLSSQRPTAIEIPTRTAAKNNEGYYECTWPECTDDTKKFSHKWAWSKHMDKHERPYICRAEGCENIQGFTFSGGLLRHERLVHGMHGRNGLTDLRCPHEGCKRNTGRGFTRINNLEEHIRRIHRPREDVNAESYRLKRTGSTASAAGSSHSLSSLASMASQASWEGKDVFDQVLQSIIDKVTALLRYLDQHSPYGIAVNKRGRERRVAHKEAKTQLQYFRGQVQGHFGIADGARRKNLFSVQYSQARDVCYPRLLDLKTCFCADLDELRKPIMSKDLTSAHISKLCQKFGTYDGKLRSMAVEMRSAALTNGEAMDLTED